MKIGKKTQDKLKRRDKKDQKINWTEGIRSKRMELMGSLCLKLDELKGKEEQESPLLLIQGVLLSL